MNDMRFVDLHCDSILEIYTKKKDLADLAGHINLEKLCRGGVLMQCFAAFIATYDCAERNGVHVGAYELFCAMADIFDRQMALYPDVLAPARSYADVVRNRAEGKISALFTVEDAVPLEGMIERVDEMYARGVRMAALLWNYENSLGFPNSPDAREHAKPLKPFGREAVERMNELISEFLDEAHFSHTTVGEIIKDLKSQISTMEYAPIVSYCVPDGSVALEVNKIRVSRMLVNLIENAYYAIDHEHGAIRLTAGPRMYEGTEMVCFALSDNGIGMDEKTQHSAFDSGFSGRGSSGLGLSFVQQVVECHHGAIRLCSKPGEGTTFYIYFPKEN